MATIEIKDVEKLMTQASQVEAVTKVVQTLKEELLSNCNQVSGAWQSETVDKESYLKDLTENIEKLSTLAQALTTLGNRLQTYAQEQHTTSQR